jgi:phosphoribosylformimino-5-aminoimidazole carboxamide ribonucleotide (ProFAR) isomerase
MLKIRVITCLDVKEGRVVKGVNFVDLRDGFAGIADIKRMLEPRYAMLEGAIAGRVLYDGRLGPREPPGLLKESA